MPNEYVNHVIVNGVTKLDLRADTITASALAQGITAHDRSGAPIVGTATGGVAAGSVSQDANGYLVLDDDAGGRYDPSDATATAADILSPKTAYVSGGKVTGQIATKTSTDLSASGDTVTVPAGYYASQVTKAVAAGSAGTPTATKGTVSNHSVSVTPSVTNTGGYISGGTKTGTAVTVSASELVSGTKEITANGTGIDVTDYASVDVSVSGGGASNIVFGEFTAGTAGSVQEVSVSYSGNGYPIFISVYPSDGYHSGTSLYDTDHQYAMVEMSALRAYPTASSTSAAYGTYLYKSQATGMAISGTRINGQNMFGTQSDPISGMGCVAIRDKDSFAVLVSNTSYGFLSGVAYKYVIVYSS